MFLFHSINCLVLLFLSVDGYDYYGKQDSFDYYAEICNKVAELPFFKKELVIGKQWRVYYVWNSIWDNTCRDMSFKRSSPLLVNHMRNAVTPFLRTEPNWDEATLFLTMSRSRHVLLLRDESGIPGNFIQVPNILENERFYVKPDEKSVPLFGMVLKLVLDGRYLIMSDCSTGVTFLLGQRSETPPWDEIRAVARTYDFGPGLPTCARS